MNIYFDLLYYLSLVRIDHTAFRLCHLWEAAAINSVLQLKFSFFFSLLLSSLLLPSPPSSGSQGQFPLTQNVTVVEGGTANLTCRVDQNDNTSLQWSNPAQQTLYFDDKKGKSFPELMVPCNFFLKKKYLKTFPFNILM